MKTLTLIFGTIGFSLGVFSQDLSDTIRFQKFNDIKKTKMDTIYRRKLFINENFQKDTSVYIKKKDTLYYCQNTILGKPFTEILYFSNKKVNQIRYKKNDGDSVVQFYLSGKLQSIVKHHEKESLEFISWYENGNIEDKKIMYGDSGIIISWHPNGEKKSETRLNKDGFVDGYNREWCENGIMFKNDLINRGKFKSAHYWCSGKKRDEYTYISVPWALVGKLTVWYENGQKELENFYEETVNKDNAGIRTGEWTYWDKKGKVLKKEWYKNGNLINKKEYFNSNGNVLK